MMMAVTHSNRLVGLCVIYVVLTISMLLGRAATTDKLPPNTELCIDHAGADKKMFTLSSANMSLCYEACVADNHCAGWVYMPPNCTFGNVPHGMSNCWLKADWPSAENDPSCCRDSGKVRDPQPSWERPTIYPPFPSCSASEPSVVLTIDPTNVTHSVNPLYMGCHLDLGYSHQPQALFSQMVYSASYELGDPTQKWDPVKTPNGIGWVPFAETADVKGNMTFDASTTLTNHSTLHLTKTDTGTGVYGVANRGLGHEGLVFQGSKSYEGYVIVSGPSAATVTVQILDRSVSPPKELASEDLEFAGGEWTKLSFSLTTSAGTGCFGIPPGSDPTVGCPAYNTYSPTAPMSDLKAHICVKCGGEFVVGVRKGAINLGFSFLQPGQWGRLGNLSVLASGADLLKEMGITAIRQGGSFALNEDYFWKHWIPRLPSNMPSVVWNDDLETGWGPFHFIDMCNMLEIEPVVTTFAVPVDPEDMADFVEYTYGNASTKWGKMRIDAGHPQPYRWRFIELGNEQYNYLFVDQVKAMEARAEALGMAKYFYYMFPCNGGVNSTDQGRAKALGLGDHLVVDIHDGATGGVGAAQGLLQNFPTWGSVNAETNCGDHTVHRMLEEAQDLISFFNADIPQLHFRAGSFCFERSGYQEGGLNDQGISFFLPNMTWLQPPGFVHKIVSKVMFTKAAYSDVTGCTEGCDATQCATAHVQVSDDGKNISVYFLNMTPDKVSLTLKLSNKWKASSPSTVQAVQIQSPDLQQSNTPSNPTAVSPQLVTLDISKAIQMPAQSFTVFMIAGSVSWI